VLAHDVIQDPVNSLPVVKFLSDFSLISSTSGADDWSKHGPTKDFFNLVAKGVHALRFALTYCSPLEAPWGKLKVIHERRCWTIWAVNASS
jgi:hypothetical protein